MSAEGRSDGRNGPDGLGRPFGNQSWGGFHPPGKAYGGPVGGARAWVDSGWGGRMSGLGGAGKHLLDTYRRAGTV